MKPTQAHKSAVCPLCGATYHRPPAISRANSEPICPDCGTREALAAMGLPKEEIEKILDVIHKHPGCGGNDD